MNDSLSTTTYSKVTRQYARRLETPLKVKWWYWLIPLLWLLLFLYGVFITAPAMEAQVESRVVSTLQAQSLQFDANADGQNVSIKAVAGQQQEGLIKALAATTTCDTWLAKNVTCPIDVNVELDASKAVVVEPSATVLLESEPKAVVVTPDPVTHDFLATKNSIGVVLAGEVASEDIRQQLIQSVSEKVSLEKETLSISQHAQKFDDQWAYEKIAEVLPLLTTGTVNWLQGMLSITGETSADNEIVIRQLFAAADNKRYLNDLTLTVFSAVAQCNNQFVTALSQSSIKFSTSSANISPASSTFLKTLSGIAAACDMNIVVEGHTDSVGAAAFNETLSLARANAVLRALVSNGVGADKLSATGFGEKKPIATNDTKKGRRLNRRIEIKVANEQ